MCLNISPHPILPAIRCHCPPEPITTAIDDPSNGQLVSPHYILVKSLNPNPNTYQWLLIWLRKNMGLHIQLQSSGNEAWEYAQAITKFCRHNVSIPSADHQHCLTHRQGAEYARFWSISTAKAVKCDNSLLLTIRCAKSAFASCL